MLIVPFKFQPHQGVSEQDSRGIETSQFPYSLAKASWNPLPPNKCWIKYWLNHIFFIVGVYFTMKYQATPYWKDGRMNSYKLGNGVDE